MHPSKIPRNKLTKTVYLTLGLLTFILGIIGLILPVLPGIPLLIASMPLIAKGSPRLHKWIEKHKIYQITQKIEQHAPLWLKVVGIILGVIISIYLYDKFLG
ncbi:MAG: hypothetical protein A3H51_00045 [Candidatus Spechtbacteria bacterium RIFCSPLOWO2_02_FULL_38_8]|uniref:DUF454 domain-containing protein n=1 Tax=Candidatus Spechtbacteria bacterium RIFCSPLOWO2_02_FULL_38_8 TaxID=1802164 RepID=A0A1G2HHK5_9BACT|nr:MAG: hypothetical protein A3H51_00045 [Candidatus Spechtbacteria bacterium RIFCSPLOWO2_02_FULL_38_8]